MTGLCIERGWPYVVAIAGTLIWFYFGAPFPTKIDQLMAATGTVAAVLVGFLWTANAIVLGLTASPVFQQLKRAGYDKRLFSYLHESGFGGLAFLVVSLVGFFLPEGQPTPLVFSFLWILIGLGAVSLYVRTATLLFSLIKKV